MSDSLDNPNALYHLPHDGWVAFAKVYNLPVTDDIEERKNALSNIVIYRDDAP